MSRLARIVFPATLLAFGLLLSGCKTTYSDMYSPKRNRFVATKEKPTEPPPIPVEETPPGSDAVGGGLFPPPPPSSAPVVPAAPLDAAPPAIPGLQ